MSASNLTEVVRLRLPVPMIEKQNRQQPRPKDNFKDWEDPQYKDLRKLFSRTQLREVLTHSSFYEHSGKGNSRYVFAGMFVKNPLLKMLLVGLGGANLLNKAGHEALENRDGVKPQPVRQYRKYDDEVLDLRISQPVMKGNTLVATIDNVPSVITINDDAVDAYYQGVLPLNTLANAVLRKRILQENYDRQIKVDERQVQSMGIK